LTAEVYNSSHLDKSGAAFTIGRAALEWPEHVAVDMIKTSAAWILLQIRPVIIDEPHTGSGVIIRGPCETIHKEWQLAGRSTFMATLELQGELKSTFNKLHQTDSGAWI